LNRIKRDGIILSEFSGVIINTGNEVYLLMVRELFEYHPVIGYRFIPNIKARIPHENGGYLISVNDSGFRCDHNFSKNKSKDKRRIIVFGDSFTAGDGISNGYRYTDILEKAVDNLEVYNFGLSGSGTDQQYLIYKEFAEGMEYDLMIIAVLVENIRRVAGHYRIWNDEKGQPVYYAKPYFVIDNGMLTLKNVPPKKASCIESEIPEEEKEFIDHGGRFPAIEKLVSRLKIKDLVQKISRYQPVPEYNRPDNPAWKVMRGILELWINNQANRILLMPIPLYQHIEGMSSPSYYQARFREVVEATGCNFYDPLPDFLACSLMERRGFRHRNDVHFTREGHAKLADSMVPIIEHIFDSISGE
jgi:hypothetical protein